MSDAAYEAVREYLALGRDLLGSRPLVEERDREEVVNLLAGWRVDGAVKEAMSGLGLPLPFHVQNLDPFAVQMMAWAASFGDPIAWRACEILAADFIAADAKLPPPLRDFTAKVLRREIERPDPKCQMKNRLRDMMIAGAVDVARNHGLEKSRNDGSDTESACDVVAACLLKEHGERRLGAARVRQIYDEQRRSP